MQRGNSMARLQSLVVLLSFLYCLVGATADLTISGVKCGARNCSPLEYCSEFTASCQSCADVCTQKHHNFDESRCTKDCQNYLHDIRYLKINQQDEGELRAEVRNLQYMVTVTLTLTCLILVFLIIVLFIKTCRWRKKHNVTVSWLRNKLKLKETSKSEKPANTVAVTANSGRPELRLDMPPIGLQTPNGNGNTPSTATTTLSRRPTEDNTLDYAYDNPVMISTPSPNPKPHESSL